MTLASTSERLAGLYVTEAGGSLSATAGRDMSIVGADLDSAGALQLVAGHDLDIKSTLSSEQKNRGSRLSSTELDRAATLSAGNDLVLAPGRDLTLTAVDVSAQGSGLLSAGRDLSLATLTTQESLSSWRNTRRESEENCTLLEIGDSLALLAGQDITARAAQLNAGDDLTLSAVRDISMEVGYSQQYEETRRGGTHTIDSQSRVQSTTLDAGGDLFLQAGNDLTLTATQLQAGQEAALMAGGDIDLLTAQENDYSFYEKKTSGGLFGSSRTQRDEVSRTRSIGSEVSTGGDLLITSGQDQTYQAARLESKGDIELRSGGTIRFETASDVHTESHERSKSSFTWQSSSGEGFTRETLRQSELVAQGELIIQAADGLQIDVEEIDSRSVSQTIDTMVAANPDLAWLQEMDERGDIDWRQVKAIHESWDYEQSGLGAGAAMVVAIVAAAWAGPAASGLLGLAEGGLAASMVTAGAGSLAGSSAVSLINNSGDLGATLSDTFSSDSLRGAATAVLTAGASHGMTNRFWGTQTNPSTGATNNLNLSFGDGSEIARFAGQRVTQAAIDAGIRTAIEGGSLSDNLEDGVESAVAHVASGVLFNAVGDLAFDNRWADGSPEKIALHALVGGSVAEAMGGDFRTGAMAAGASEALVHHLVENGRANPVLSNTIAQLVGIVAAELSGGDVNDGAFIAGQVESYNRQLHTRERELLAEQAVALEERLGSPQLQDTTWDDMLLLVSGAALDEQEAQRFMVLLDQLESSSNDNNPLYQRFLQDLQTASAALQDLSSRYAGQALTWAIGEPITAHGEPVTTFQATEAQYRDSALFGQSGSGLLGETANYWRQYGFAQGTEHLWESLAFGFESQNAGLHDQAFNSVLGGRVEPFTLIDETVIDAVSGGGASAATKIAARATNPKQVADWLKSRINRGEAATYRGGPHSQTRKPVGDGLDSHHLPADSVSSIPREHGPAIQMDPIDHRATSSHGSQGLAGAEYRLEVGRLIQEGRVRDAMALEVRDVRRAALEVSGDRTKYNQALQEMLEYTRSNGWLEKK